MPYRLLLLTVIILLILGLTACAPQPAPIAASPISTATRAPVANVTLQPELSATANVQSTATALPAPTNADLPTTDSHSANLLESPGALDGPLQTYANRSANFSMDFPADWKIIDISEQINATRMYTVSANSPMQPRGPKQQEGLLPGESKMDISVNPSEKPMSYEEALVYWRGNIIGGEFPAKILDEKSGQLPSGLRATRWIVQSDRSDPVVWTLVEINGNIVNFIGMGDLTLLDKITATVRAGE